MNRFFLVILVAVFAALPVWAQNPISTEAQQAWTRTIGNAVAAAEKMPEENYSFKPAPESQSFGDLVAHTASSALGVCSSVTGEMNPIKVTGTSAKADLVAAMNAAKVVCEKAYGSLTDANTADMIEGRRGKRTRIGTLYGNTIHIEHEYAQMAVHMRLKGLVPPSSERR
jgi:hypothetical protein